MPLLIFVIFAIAFMWMFFYLIPVRLWITAIASGVHIGILSLVGMRLRKVSPHIIINSLVMSHKAGLSLNTDRLEAHYLALALVDFICTLSPQRIILGGGVMEQTQLFPLIRQETLQLLNGYIQASAILDEIETFIVPPGLGGQAGIFGALALAQEAIME